MCCGTCISSAVPHLVLKDKNSKMGLIICPCGTSEKGTRFLYSLVHGGLKGEWLCPVGDGLICIYHVR